MDVQVIKMSHELVGRAISKKGVTEFSDTEYSLALTVLLTGDGRRDWSILSNECAKIIFQSNYSVNTLGTFEATPLNIGQENTQRQKRHRRELVSLN